ncbi:MAG: hypothetical protein HMLKMBBP_03129 [Planctomycetes bacterium]|nr:hypothetical protein [Planctomycetota bacterium]
MSRRIGTLAALAALAVPLGVGGCDDVDTQFSNPVFVIGIKATYKTDPERGRGKTFRIARRNVAGGVSFDLPKKTGGFVAYDFDAPQFEGTFDDGPVDSVAIAAEGTEGNGVAYWTEFQLEAMANRGVATKRDRVVQAFLDFNITSATLSGEVTCEDDDPQALEVEAVVEFEGTVVQEQSKDGPTPISGKLKIKGIGDATFNGLATGK